MTFKFENQMIHPAENWLIFQGLTTKREFYMPWGTCDLVGCSFDEEKVTKRLSYGQSKPIGPQMRIMILSLIPDMEEGKSIDIEHLYNEFSGLYAAESIVADVTRLIKNKFVVRTADGGLQKLNGWLPLHQRIVALELKLNRVNDALLQAISNQKFADESYVGLPIKRARQVMRSKKASEFVAEGVGIIGIRDKKCAVMIIASQVRRKPDPIFQIHCVERFWRTGRPAIRGNSA